MDDGNKNYGCVLLIAVLFTSFLSTSFFFYLPFFPLSRFVIGFALRTVFFLPLAFPLGLEGELWVLAYAGGVFLRCCFAVAVLDAGHRIALLELGSTLHGCSHLSSSLFFIALSVASGLGHGYNTWSVGERRRPVEGSTCQLGLFNNRIVGGVAFLA